MLSLTSPYTVLFQPLLAPGADPVAVRHGRWGGICGGSTLVRLEALDPDWPGLAPLLAGMRRAGMLAQRFDHFGNWHEDLAGRCWAAYLAARPGALRETIRRRGRAAAKDQAIRFETVTGRRAAGAGDGGVRGHLHAELEGAGAVPAVQCDAAAAARPSSACCGWG